jgi:fumarylpyruvate hydrolase
MPLQVQRSEVVTTVTVAGSSHSFPVRRVYCIGRNYADHATEMTATSQTARLEPPFHFLKPADNVTQRTDVPYPPRTALLHHEVELVAAIGASGADVPVDDALDLVVAYGVGIDLTRRDLQQEARATGKPWECGKAFDFAAPLSPLVPVSDIGHPDAARIWLDVNGGPRQAGDIAQMTTSVAGLVAYLSRLSELRPGDLVFTGTPAGVGPLEPGDEAVGGVDGVDVVTIRIVPR